MQPSYYVSIERIDTEQHVFIGVVRGPLTPLIEGDILDHARLIDAGKSLSTRQRKKAYPRAR